MCCQQTHPKRMAKGSSPNRKKNFSLRTLGTLGRKKGNFTFSLEFPRSKLMIEAQIVTWSELVLNECRGNI